MRQPFLIAILVVLGFVAAVAAAALVVFMQMPDTVTVEGEDGEPAEAPGVTVLTAAADISPRTVLDEQHIEETEMPRGEAPDHHFTNRNDVVGRMVVAPVTAGQPLTRRLFPAPGSGYALAGLLPTGMRAVSVTMPGHSGLDGLLYPGSVVDVLTHFPLRGDTELGSAVSTTLLENIQVLAVENVAVTSEQYGEEEQTDANAGSRSTLKVTLMVNSKQAEALQLAMQHGDISLALRNPRDEDSALEEATLLNEGYMARFATLMGAREGMPDGFLEALMTEAEPEPEPEPAPAPPPREPEPPRIEVDILRGTVTETKSFEDRR